MVETLELTVKNHCLPRVALLTLNVWNIVFSLDEMLIFLWSFQYDNILMEESAQILEIETFIPLLLQVGPEENKTLTFHILCLCVLNLRYLLGHTDSRHSHNPKPVLKPSFLTLWVAVVSSDVKVFKARDQLWNHLASSRSIKLRLGPHPPQIKKFVEVHQLLSSVAVAPGSC